MITYDQQNKFYNQLLGIVEKMGGHSSAHGNLHGIFLSVIVLKCWRLLVSYRMMSITVLMMNTMI